MVVILNHHNDVIMSALAFQITNLTNVDSTVYSGTDQRKHQKLRITGLCAGNSPATDEFPAQRTSNAENVSIWWRHHDQVKDHLSCLWNIVVWDFPSFGTCMSLIPRKQRSSDRHLLTSIRCKVFESMSNRCRSECLCYLDSSSFVLGFNVDDFADINDLNIFIQVLLLCVFWEFPYTSHT